MMDPNEPKASTQIQKALDGRIRLARRQGSCTALRATVEATTPAGTVSVAVEDADRLGVLAGPVGAARPDGRPGSVPAQAQEAARRLTYLQEPLAVIETDARRGTGVLRSPAPRRVEGGGEYNEAVLDGGGSITISRYRTEQGARRRQVPSNLSRETLGRLVDDLGEILRTD